MTHVLADNAAILASTSALSFVRPERDLLCRMTGPPTSSDNLPVYKLAAVVRMEARIRNGNSVIAALIRRPSRLRLSFTQATTSHGNLVDQVEAVYPLGFFRSALVNGIDAQMSGFCRQGSALPLTPMGICRFWSCLRDGFCLYAGLSRML